MASTLQIGETLNTMVDVPVEPDTYSWSVNDISAPDAGRVQDADCTMYTKRVGRKRKLSVQWFNISLFDASTILKMLRPEYIYVRFLDIEEGKFITKYFYTGDKQTSVRMVDITDPSNPSNRTTLSSLPVNLIEQ